MVKPSLRTYVFCLALALSFALLPLSLLLASTTEPCAPTEGLESISVLASGNPFSHDNLCRIRERLGHLRRRDQPTAKVVTAQDPVEIPTEQSASAAAAAAAASSAALRAPSPPAVSSADFEKTEGGDIPDIEFSKAEEDRERIKKLPHVSTCFFCKVCIPMAAAGASDAESVRLRQLLQDHDDAAAAAGARPDQYDFPDPDRYTVVPNPSGAGSTDEGEDSGDALFDEAGYRRSTDDWSAAVHGGVSHQLGSSAGPIYRGPGRGQHHGGQQQQQQHRRLLGEKEDEAIARAESESDPFYHMNGTITDLTNIAPGLSWRKGKEHLPNCSMCWGCDNSLDMMASGSIMADSYYAHEPGGSPSWLFRARTNRTASGYAVVKTWCVPILKAKQRGLAMCSPKKVYSQVKLLLAQQKITEECGFDDIVPKLWIDRVNGVIPGNGFHISWMGLWFDVAEGVSIQNFHDAGRPRAKPEVLLDMLTRRINSTQIVRGSIFDVLFSQCDRHQQNLFITETGKVTLIDNDQVFTTAWRKCGFDSITIPVTQKFYINQLGFFYVLKYPQKEPPRTWNKVVNPLIMLDYRCHAPGGLIGKSFDPKLTQCLNKLSGMTKEEIQEAYGYPNLRMADAIRNRSRDLLTKGFEWTLLHGQPANQPMHRYKVPQKCCNMTYTARGNRYNCTTPWEPMLDIPYGNAWHGGVFNGPIDKDTGNYVGGSSFT